MPIYPAYPVPQRRTAPRSATRTFSSTDHGGGSRVALPRQPTAPPAVAARSQSQPRGYVAVGPVRAGSAPVGATAFPPVAPARRGRTTVLPRTHENAEVPATTLATTPSPPRDSAVDRMSEKLQRVRRGGALTFAPSSVVLENAGGGWPQAALPAHDNRQAVRRSLDSQRVSTAQHPPATANVSSAAAARQQQQPALTHSRARSDMVAVERMDALDSAGRDLHTTQVLSRRAQADRLLQSTSSEWGVAESGQRDYRQPFPPSATTDGGRVGPRGAVAAAGPSKRVAFDESSLTRRTAQPWSREQPVRSSLSPAYSPSQPAYVTESPLTASIASQLHARSRGSNGAFAPGAFVRDSDSDATGTTTIHNTPLHTAERSPSASRPLPSADPVRAYPQQPPRDASSGALVLFRESAHLHQQQQQQQTTVRPSPVPNADASVVAHYYGMPDHGAACAPRGQLYLRRHAKLKARVADSNLLQRQRQQVERNATAYEDSDLTLSPPYSPQQWHGTGRTQPIPAPLPTPPSAPHAARLALPPPPPVRQAPLPQTQSMLLSYNPYQAPPPPPPPQWQQQQEQDELRWQQEQDELRWQQEQQEIRWQQQQQQQQQRQQWTYSREAAPYHITSAADGHSPYSRVAPSPPVGVSSIAAANTTSATLKSTDSSTPTRETIPAGSPYGAQPTRNVSPHKLAAAGADAGGSVQRARHGAPTPAGAPSPPAHPRLQQHSAESGMSLNALPSAGVASNYRPPVIDPTRTAVRPTPTAPVPGKRAGPRAHEIEGVAPSGTHGLDGAMAPDDVLSSQPSTTRQSPVEPSLQPLKNYYRQFRTSEVVAELPPPPQAQRRATLPPVVQPTSADEQELLPTQQQQQRPEAAVVGRPASLAQRQEIFERQRADTTSMPWVDVARYFSGLEVSGKTDEELLLELESRLGAEEEQERLEQEREMHRAEQKLLQEQQARQHQQFLDSQLAKERAEKAARDREQARIDKEALESQLAMEQQARQQAEDEAVLHADGMRSTSSPGEVALPSTEAARRAVKKQDELAMEEGQRQDAEAVPVHLEPPLVLTPSAEGNSNSLPAGEEDVVDEDASNSDSSAVHGEDDWLARTAQHAATVTVSTAEAYDAYSLTSLQAYTQYTSLEDQYVRVNEETGEEMEDVLHVVECTQHDRLLGKRYYVAKGLNLEVLPMLRYPNASSYSAGDHADGSSSISSGSINHRAGAPAHGPPALEEFPMTRKAFVNLCAAAWLSRFDTNNVTQFVSQAGWKLHDLNDAPLPPVLPLATSGSNANTSNAAVDWDGILRDYELPTFDNDTPFLRQLDSLFSWCVRNWVEQDGVNDAPSTDLRTPDVVAFAQSEKFSLPPEVDTSTVSAKENFPARCRALTDTDNLRCWPTSFWLHSPPDGFAAHVTNVLLQCTVPSELAARMCAGSTSYEDEDAGGMPARLPVPTLRSTVANSPLAKARAAWPLFLGAPQWGNDTSVPSTAANADGEPRTSDGLPMPPPAARVAYGFLSRARAYNISGGVGALFFSILTQQLPEAAFFDSMLMLQKLRLTLMHCGTPRQPPSSTTSVSTPRTALADVVAGGWAAQPTVAEAAAQLFCFFPQKTVRSMRAVCAALVEDLVALGTMELPSGEYIPSELVPHAEHHRDGAGDDEAALQRAQFIESFMVGGLVQSLVSAGLRDDTSRGVRRIGHRGGSSGDAEDDMAETSDRARTAQAQQQCEEDEVWEDAMNSVGNLHSEEVYRWNASALGSDATVRLEHDIAVLARTRVPVVDLFLYDEGQDGLLANSSLASNPFPAASPALRYGCASRLVEVARLQYIEDMLSSSMRLQEAVLRAPELERTPSRGNPSDGTAAEDEDENADSMRGVVASVWSVFRALRDADPAKPPSVHADYLKHLMLLYCETHRVEDDILAAVNDANESCESYEDLRVAMGLEADEEAAAGSSDPHDAAAARELRVEVALRTVFHSIKLASAAATTDADGEQQLPQTHDRLCELVQVQVQELAAMCPRVLSRSVGCPAQPDTELGSGGAEDFTE